MIGLGKVVGGLVARSCKGVPLAFFERESALEREREDEGEGVVVGLIGMGSVFIYGGR